MLRSVLTGQRLSECTFRLCTSSNFGKRTNELQLIIMSDFDQFSIVVAVFLGPSVSDKPTGVVLSRELHPCINKKKTTNVHC